MSATTAGRRIAVLSATVDPTYAFFAPLTALIWREVTGFDPLLLLVGGEEAWRADARAAVALDEAAHHAEIVFVPAVAGAAAHTLAQVVRLCGAALDGGDNDYLLVSDVDLWPLNAQRFRLRQGKQMFQIMNADAYGTEADRFPMCYLGGPRALWREIFSLDGGLAAALGRMPWPADGDWHFDEKFASASLRAWSGFAARALQLPRPAGAGHGRLDRADWQFPDGAGAGRLRGLVDAHLLRPGFSPENWPRLRALLASLLTGAKLRAAIDYHARYQAAAAPASLASPPSSVSVPAPIANDAGALEDAFRLWFRAFAARAPEPYRSYGGYGDGLPNGTACSLEAIRVFASLVGDPDAVILNAGAGVSSFLLRRLFRNVVCVDSDPTYLNIVRDLCVGHGLSGDGFIAGLENAPDADFTFFDYGAITEQERLGYYAMAYRKTRRAVYCDDADDRPHGFPLLRQRLIDFAAAQGVAAVDRRDAIDRYGRWGVVVPKAPAATGPGLIAFGLWGGQALYVRGALENVRAAAQHYPGYRVRIYTDDPMVLDQAASALSGGAAADAAGFAAGAGTPLEVVVMPPNQGIRGMFWRFLAASDQQADPILFRDCDSRLNPREASAVRAWLGSGRRFHVMHDHPHHADWPMLGGMWGVRGGVVTDMEARIAAFGLWAQKPDDMHFLTAHVWPEARRDVVHHASVATHVAPAVPFPPHAPWSGFVGQIVGP
ncbi:MAG TPA: hypothetical protein VGL59_01450 [Polyangia bacterium]|jgi:hypothetical protein